jgi:hypothetical protein
MEFASVLVFHVMTLLVHVFALEMTQLDVADERLALMLSTGTMQEVELLFHTLGAVQALQSGELFAPLLQDKGGATLTTTLLLLVPPGPMQLMV